VPYAASQFTPHERAQPLGGGPASEGYGGRSPYIQPPSSSGGGLRAALGVGVVALLAAFWILDPLDLQLGANFDGAGDAMADAKEGEQARRDRVFQLRGSKSNDLAAVLELLAPTPDIQPDARFVAALRWLNAASGDASASVELRAAGGNHEVFVADKRVGSWNRVPSALALWSVIDAHASGVAAAIEWSGEAPREANWGEVADTSKALAVAEETAKAWRAGKQTRAIAARHATALVALVLLAPADLGASDDLAANAIGAVALAAAAGAPMEGQRAALEHALGYTVQAAGRELPADLPSGLRTALTSAGQRRTVAAHGDATPLEHAALLRHSTEGDDVADYAALVDDAVRRAPRDLAVSYLQFRATWAPIHIDDHLARIEATCVGAAAHANDRGTKERMYEAPKRLSKLLASLPDGSDRAFDADDVRGAFCRAHAHDTIDDLVHFVVDVQGAPGSEQFPRVFTSPRPEDAGFLESLQLCAEARRAKGLGPELAKRAFARDDLLPRAWQALLPLALRKGRFNDEVTVISDRLVAHLDGRPSRREALAKHIASLGERAAADGVLASILDDSGRSLASASAEALSAAEDVDALLAWALDDGATSPARNAALDQLVSLSPREGLDIGADRLSRAMDLAITATPRASSALDRKADWLHDQARHEEVVALMEAAIARGEFADGLGEAVAYTNLARAQRNLGRYPEALAAASKAAELGTAASFDELARALTHVGELAEAKRVHQARVQRYPWRRLGARTTGVDPRRARRGRPRVARRSQAPARHGGARTAARRGVPAGARGRRGATVARAGRDDDPCARRDHRRSLSAHRSRRARHVPRAQGTLRGRHPPDPREAGDRPLEASPGQQGLRRRTPRGLHTRRHSRPRDAPPAAAARRHRSRRSARRLRV
jgi:tetratricopeptide (TPR) repeat protein